MLGHPPAATAREDIAPKDRDDPAYRGQSDYTRALLNVYDPMVLGLAARFVWRCPTTILVEGYRQHVRERHLDVGPGTGYFLGRSGLPDGIPVTLAAPLHAARRLRHLDITAVEADVCKPLPIDGTFESAAPHLVIHCLPGPLTRKAAAVANVATVLAPTGVLFGASVLATTETHSWPARRVLDAFNRRGAFDNRSDTATALHQILSASFERVELETVGSIAIFSATGPNTSPR